LRRWAWAACLFPWLLLLVLPSATTFTSTYSWDASPYYLLFVTSWLFAFLWIGLGVRGFFIATYPLALFSALFVGADFLRNANLLELAMVMGGMRSHEVVDAVRPYVAVMLVCAAVLVLPVVAAWRRASAMRPRPLALIGFAAVGVALLLIAPATFLRAWPINLVSLAAASSLGHAEFVATALPWAPLNPRKAGTTWNARRALASLPATETFVLIIGESVRADRLKACGHPRPVAMTKPSLVYCDVMAGSSSTHTAVPLLVSREMPGSTIRVSSDATFMRAFEEAGFRTYWLSLQGESIAWPDAQVERYEDVRGTDREMLLPLLKAALAERAPRKLIVLHAYGAHAPYCSRYAAANSIVPADCANAGTVMTHEKREIWRDAYDNAVAESLAFVDAVIAELESQGGHAFVAFTSDHGENLMDDDRGLFAHSLKEPTRFDTRVPFIFWASSGWRAGNAARWDKLRANAGARAMHADLVPTLLGAAAIEYADKRSDAVDLTRASPGPRVRWVSKRLGSTLDGDSLR
jgi:glucan phosphoethanolaminetransferase (alkaline phosphatase superfamily)